MFDEFIDKYKFWIGGTLIVVILAGGGFLVWNKIGQNKKVQENQTIQNLQVENDKLRQELSSGAEQQVAGAATTASISDKININTADAAGLDKLPGIGPARAADMISYRESHGGFKTIEEMKNIKGIGDKTFESMKDLITVGE